MEINKIIAIDPDVDMSGYCILDFVNMSYEYGRKSFGEMLDLYHEIGKSSKIIVEAGYLNKSNWHVKKSNPIVSAQIGNRTGRNHEVARKLIEMARYYNLDVEEIKPLSKGWSGSGGKITQLELNNVLSHHNLPNLDKRTNQDERDSIIIALAYFNRIKFINR